MSCWNWPSFQGNWVIGLSCFVILHVSGEAFYWHGPVTQKMFSFCPVRKTRNGGQWINLVCFCPFCQFLFLLLPISQAHHVRGLFKVLHFQQIARHACVLISGNDLLLCRHVLIRVKAQKKSASPMWHTTQLDFRNDLFVVSFPFCCLQVLCVTI